MTIALKGLVYWTTSHHTSAPPRVSPTSWCSSYSRAAHVCVPRHTARGILQIPLQSIQQTPKSKLSLTCIAREMDKYRDLEIHTELQKKKNKMLSRPETYCEYANITVSGTQALPFSTCLTPSFSLHHAPLPPVFPICLFFPKLPFLKIWCHLLKIREIWCHKYRCQV